MSDPRARLYYRYYVGTRVGDKYLRTSAMAARNVKIWYDQEGDYLEVMFEQKEGYFRETSSDQVMEKVDAEGNVLGFSVLKVSAVRKHPLEVTL